jgi:hypothetical protein
MRIALALFAVALVPLWWAACGDDPPPAGCTPGAMLSCICGNGETSSALCKADRTFAPCACTDDPPDLSVAIFDAAQPVDLATPPPDFACAPIMNGKRVFATSTTYNGDLKTAGGGADGLDGGDKLCQTRADAASLGGSWKAWLSSTTVDAIDRLPDVGPWYLIDRCTMVFQSKTAITQSDPMVAIHRNELGVTAATPGFWTGTDSDGTRDSDRCLDWTSAASTEDGAVGGGAASFLPGLWSSFLPSSCDMAMRLICFEQ